MGVDKVTWSNGVDVLLSVEKYETWFTVVWAFQQVGVVFDHFHTSAVFVHLLEVAFVINHKMLETLIIQGGIGPPPISVDDGILFYMAFNQ